MPVPQPRRPLRQVRLLEDIQGVLLLTKDTNPKTIYGLAKPAVRNVPPAAIMEVGGVMALGAAKYGPMNWRADAVSYSTYYDAAIRHLFAAWDGQDIDTESGHLHLAHAAANLMILIDASIGGQLIDDRPWPGMAAAYIATRTKALVDDREVQAQDSPADS